jgi:hypothetical protein
MQTCYQASCLSCGFELQTAGLNSAIELERAIEWAISHYRAPVPGQPDYVCDSNLITIVGRARFDDRPTLAVRRSKHHRDREAGPQCVITRAGRDAPTRRLARTN